MYVIVTDDNLAAEPEPGSLRCKTSRRQQQIRAGRRSSVSAERYDPERAADDDPGADDPAAVVPKTADQRRRLADAVRDILLFRSIDVILRGYSIIGSGSGFTANLGSDSLGKSNDLGVSSVSRIHFGFGLSQIPLR